MNIKYVYKGMVRNPLQHRWVQLQMHPEANLG